MKKIIVLKCFLIIAVFGWSQPTIQPLLFDGANHNFQEKHFSKSTNTFDSTFYYLLDTLSLPVIDDFTKNRFQQYDAKINDGNIIDSTLHTIWDATNTTIEPWGTTGMYDTTYRIVVDSLTDGTLTYDSTALSSIDYFIYDLTSYPSVNGVDELWPAYTIYDTLFISGDQSDTVYFTPADVIQDSATIFIVNDSNPEIYWVDNRAYWNYRYPHNPNSQGVATLDGLDENGIPYQLGNLSSHGLADVLTSKFINLNVPASDSVYFSFSYQAKGLGNSPEAIDSLVLEFYIPSQDIWSHAWSTGGGIVDSTNFLVHIPIKSPDLLTEGFRFRFKNYANLSGSLDHWHIDYVRLRAPASYQDIVINDLAIMYPLNTLLETYTSVPWKHYQANPSFFMGNNVTTVPVRNNNVASKQTNPGDIFVDYKGVNQLSFNVGDPLGNYAGSATYDFPFDFSASSYSFDTGVNDTAATFDVTTVLTTPTNPELLTVNDSATFQQVFKNYYAYDDGSAEAAFGIIGQGAMLAVRFDMPQADTLRAVQMHFAPFNEDFSNRVFLMTVWDDNNGEPGNVLYEDDYFTASQIVYEPTVNGYRYYFFGGNHENFVEVPETFYIGWRHPDESSLNIGFDRNIDNYDKVFYSLGSTWEALTDNFAGTPMIRPVVSSKMNYILGVTENEIILDEQISKIYPNPADEFISIEYGFDQDSYNIQLIDLSGRIVREFAKSNRIDISNFTPGIYLIKINNLSKNKSETLKVIIK